MTVFARISEIPGCVEYQSQFHQDERGTFVKPFEANIGQASAQFRIAEAFWSKSHRNVLRGLHFQLPPHAVEKLVWCTEGTVLDVVVDLRTNLTTFGKVHRLELSASRGNAVFVPEGCAHGFLVLSDSATVCYVQSGRYEPEYDSGILWSSVATEWPVSAPIISLRDANHPPIDDFESPFESISS